jgi:hypothetical protein
METFFENLSKNSVVTATANVENNVYASALAAYMLLSDKQKKAFDISFKAYQMKWYLSISYGVTKQVSKESKDRGIPFVRKYSKIVTHFEDYQKLVEKENGDFVAKERTWGERVNEVCVYHKGQLYLSMKPTYTSKAQYFIPNALGETEISYLEEQLLLNSSSRDVYKHNQTASRQGVDLDNVVRCADIKIENVGSIKCGKSQEVNEIELELI